MYLGHYGLLVSWRSDDDNTFPSQPDMMQRLPTQGKAKIEHTPLGGPVIVCLLSVTGFRETTAPTHVPVSLYCTLNMPRSYAELLVIFLLMHEYWAFEKTYMGSSFIPIELGTGRFQVLPGVEAKRGARGGSVSCKVFCVWSGVCSSD